MKSVVHTFKGSHARDRDGHCIVTGEVLWETASEAS